MKLFEHLGIDKSAAVSKRADGNRAARRVIELLKQNPNLIDRFPDPWQLFSKNNYVDEYIPADIRRRYFYRNAFAPQGFNNIFSTKNHSLMRSKIGANRMKDLTTKFRERPLDPRWEEPVYRRMRGMDSHRIYHNLKFEDYRALKPYFHQHGQSYEEAAQELQEILKNPSVDKVRPGVEISVNDLPYDPYKFGWKGSGSRTPFEGKNLFVSGAAPVSAGYNSGSGQTYLARIKPHHLEQGLPTGATPSADAPFYTHHVSRVEPEKRLDYLKRSENYLHNRKPVFDPNYPGGHNSDWENFKNYETVVDFKKPVQPRWKVEKGIARPVKSVHRPPSLGELGALESIRPGNPQGFFPLDMSVQNVPLQEGKRWATDEDYLTALKKQWASEYGGDLSQKVVPFKGGIFEAFKPTAQTAEAIENTGIKSMAGRLWGAAKQTLPNILKKIRL